jgi:hypothetical protein
VSVGEHEHDLVCVRDDVQDCVGGESVFDCDFVGVTDIVHKWVRVKDEVSVGVEVEVCEIDFVSVVVQERDDVTENECVIVDVEGKVCDMVDVSDGEICAVDVTVTEVVCVLDKVTRLVVVDVTVEVGNGVLVDVVVQEIVLISVDDADGVMVVVGL